MKKLLIIAAVFLFSCTGTTSNNEPNELQDPPVLPVKEPSLENDSLIDGRDSAIGK